MMQTEDKQISLTDPDARSMATSGRGSGLVGYNVQSAVDTKHHLIVAHEVTNVGSDRSQLSHMTERARAAIGSETIEAVADRGYYSGEEILACEEAGITVYLPKPMTSGINAKGRFGKQDFVYVAEDDVYLCPAGERLTYHYSNEEDGKTLRRYWTTACQTCALKSKCTTGKERRISRWEHEAVLEAVQARLDRNPDKMRVRRQTVEHPFGTIKSWMGSTHFQMKTLKHVSTEMALHVLAYNMKRLISILGVGGLIEAIPGCVGQLVGPAKPYPTAFLHSLDPKETSLGPEAWVARALMLSIICGHAPLRCATALIISWIQSPRVERTGRTESL
jgi:hypothetical protein